VCLTGKKKFKKLYWRHTGYPGGIKKIKFLEMQAKFPERINILFSKKNVAKE
jgi:large subunit ribosomal protein L13